MHGEEEEILDGTQLAADWTFSGLQKFGQGLLDRLKGLRLGNKLLEKVNILYLFKLPRESTVLMMFNEPFPITSGEYRRDTRNFRNSKASPTFIPV